MIFQKIIFLNVIEKTKKECFLIWKHVFPVMDAHAWFLGKHSFLPCWSS